MLGVFKTFIGEASDDEKEEEVKGEENKKDFKVISKLRETTKNIRTD